MPFFSITSKTPTGSDADNNLYISVCTRSPESSSIFGANFTQAASPSLSRADKLP
jgi:hypothetical protein